MAVPFTGWLDAIPLRLYQAFRHSLPSMWELETSSEDGRNLESVRGDLVTIIRLNGLRYGPTDEEIRRSSARIRATIKPALANRSIQFLFLCDPDSHADLHREAPCGRAQLRRGHRPERRRAAG